VGLRLGFRQTELDAIADVLESKLSDKKVPIGQICEAVANNLDIPECLLQALRTEQLRRSVVAMSASPAGRRPVERTAILPRGCRGDLPVGSLPGSPGGSSEFEVGALSRSLPRIGRLSPRDGVSRSRSGSAVLASLRPTSAATSSPTVAEPRALDVSSQHPATVIVRALPTDTLVPGSPPESAGSRRRRESPWSTRQVQLPSQACLDSAFNDAGASINSSVPGIESEATSRSFEAGASVNCDAAGLSCTTGPVDASKVPEVNATFEEANVEAKAEAKVEAKEVRADAKAEIKAKVKTEVSTQQVPTRPSPAAARVRSESATPVCRGRMVTTGRAAVALSGRKPSNDRCTQTPLSSEKTILRRAGPIVKKTLQHDKNAVTEDKENSSQGAKGPLVQADLRCPARKFADQQEEPKGLRKATGLRSPQVTPSRPLPRGGLEARASPGHKADAKPSGLRASSTKARSLAGSCSVMPASGRGEDQPTPENPVRETQTLTSASITTAAAIAPMPTFLSVQSHLVCTSDSPLCRRPGSSLITQSGGGSPGSPRGDPQSKQQQRPLRDARPCATPLRSGRATCASIQDSRCKAVENSRSYRAQHARPLVQRPVAVHRSSSSTCLRHTFRGGFGGSARTTD